MKIHQVESNSTLQISIDLVDSDLCEAIPMISKQ